METLYQSEDAVRVVRLTSPVEVEKFLTTLERIAVELSWCPGDQLRAFQDTALHLAVLVDGDMAGGLQVVVGAGGPSGRAGACGPTRIWRGQSRRT